MNRTKLPMNATNNPFTSHEPWWHTLLGTVLSALSFAIGWLCL
ncbi:MAG TPA: hypothetical protein VMS21_08790 [Methylomirabilota bacterium]|nr:hypothetical protein [Methylomirabilota bacterium]